MLSQQINRNIYIYVFIYICVCTFVCYTNDILQGAASVSFVSDRVKRRMSVLAQIRKDKCGFPSASKAKSFNFSNTHTHTYIYNTYVVLQVISHIFFIRYLSIVLVI